MIQQSGIWTYWKFEFDTGDERGLAWQSGCGTNNSVEESTRHFEKNGYTIIEWDDSI